MNSMHTCEKVALIRAPAGMDISTFKSLPELVEHYMLSELATESAEEHLDMMLKVFAEIPCQMDRVSREYEVQNPLRKSPITGDITTCPRCGSPTQHSYGGDTNCPSCQWPSYLNGEEPVELPDRVRECDICDTCEDCTQKEFCPSPIDDRPDPVPDPDSDEVTDREIEVAFLGSTFGNRDKTAVLSQAVLKCQAGIYNAGTISRIMKGLKLVDEFGNVTLRGRKYLYQALKS